jgi:TRAP-type mannitol/chloroaromatic compound transport system substrate-binding protein
VTTRPRTLVAWLAAASILAMPTAALAQAKQRWKLASAVTGSAPLVGAAGKRIADQIGKVTDGSVDVRFFEPGALVPPLEVFDAVSKGSIDAGWHATGYITGKIPAAAFFVGYPFGPYAQEYLAWYYHGGGQALHERLYKPFNVKTIQCTALAPEAFGWFRREIKSVEDLRGLKIRNAGLGAKVLDKAGASAQLLAPGEIYQALERGMIDGAENSSPAIDVKAGYHQIAKNYYFPGWHQPVAMWELIINMDRWNALTPAQRLQIEAACGDNIAHSIAEGEAAQTAALDEIKKSGVQVSRLPEPVLKVLEEKWREVAAEESARNADFKEIWDSVSAFRTRYEAWRAVRQ